MGFTKYIRITAFALLMLALPVDDSFAGNASQFVGWYKVLSSTYTTPKTEFMLVDNDTLGVLWERYVESSLPDNLQQYKDQLTILTGFIQRDFIVICFEATSIITPRYLKVIRGESDVLELYQRDDGNYDMATREDGKIDRYLLAPPVPRPGNQFLVDWKRTFSAKFRLTDPAVHIKSIVFE